MVQGGLDIIVGLFRQVGLMSNIAKSKIITCWPGTILLGMPEEVLGRRITGRGATYQEILRRWITYPDYGVDFTAGLMTAY